MQLGLLTAILDGWSFEEMVDTAADLGFSCIEAACWPRGSAERRYAGVSHIDCARVCSDPAYAEYVLAYIRGRNLHISALAYYPNTMDPDPVKRAANVAHLKTVIRAAQRLGVDMVTTFVGRDQYKTVEENLALFDAVWPELISLAEASRVKIAIENCPMLFGPDQWPGGQNLMCTPDIFRQVFARVSSPYFGANFFDGAQDLLETPVSHDIHGGEIEASYLSYALPHVFHGDQATPENDVYVELKDYHYGWLSRELSPNNGLIGMASRATVEKGRQLYEYVWKKLMLYFEEFDRSVS